MKESITSETTGKTYCPSECIRLVNMKQLAAYMVYGVELQDIYASRDFKTNVPILVGIVKREDSKQAYEKWCNYELK